MRRTRHVVLPVRSWQYIGLLIVSLACLTLGLVARDREGHAGNLAGPELTHQAPHEVDACPNLNVMINNKMPSCSIAKPEEPTKPVDDRKTVISESRESPASKRSVFSRSFSLDRSSRIDSQEIREQSRSRDVRAIDRLSRTRTRVFDEANRRLRESPLRTTARDIRNSFDTIRSRDLSNRATDRRSAEHRSQNFQRRLTDRTNSRVEDRRSRSMERRESNEIARRQIRVERSMDSRRNSLNLQRRTSVDRDRRSPSMERRLASEINRQESRKMSHERREYRDLARDRVDRRSDMREHRSLRSVERNLVRSSRHEDRRNLLDRSARIARGDIDRNNNLDRRNRERSIEARRVLSNRVVSQIRSSVATRDSDRDLIRSNSRRSLSRSMEHLSSNDRSRETLGRRVRSMESNIERSNNLKLSTERRSLVRSMERHENNHLERRTGENRLSYDRKSLDRATSRVLPADYRDRRISHSQRIVNQRDSRENRARENSRATLTRSRPNFEEIASRERKKRFARSSGSVNSNSIDRREFARIRDSRNQEHKLRDSSAARRDLSLERRERSNRLYRSREERRIVPQKSRETERRLSERISERRFSERQITADSARLESRRLSERRINDNSKSREGSRMADRRLERSPEPRVSRERILEKRSFHSQKSSERRIDSGSKSREGSRITDQRLERSRELQNSRGRISERRSLENPESRREFRMQNRVRINSELRNSMRMMEHRANSRVFSENKVLRSSERRADARRDPHIRNQKEHRARSAETSDKEFIKQQHQKSTNLNIVKEPSRHISLDRVVRVSRIPNQIREQLKLSAERTLSRITDNNRLSAKWERNLQNTRIDRNMGIWTKTVPESKNYEFLNYHVNYDLMKQAFLMALCTVYGFSLYNGKKSYISSNVMQRVQRFMIW